MDFAFLNDINPTLIRANHINKLNCPPLGYSYGIRTVEYYEMDFITWGEGWIITDGIKIPATRGCLFFRKPGMIVEGLPPYHSYFLVFSMSDIKSTDAILNQNTSFVRKSSDILPGFPKTMIIDNIPHIEELFAKVFEEYISQNPLSPFISKVYIMDILYYLYSEWVSSSRFENLRKSLRLNYKKILKVKCFIENNVDKHFTLNELSEISGLSKYFFCRIFKELTGESPISYMNKCKINNAKRLLLETDISIKEIIYECGFNNESYFFKLFKSIVGTSPSLFKEANKII